MSEDYIRGFCKTASVHGVSDTRLQKVAQILRHTKVLGNPTLKLINRLLRSHRYPCMTRTFRDALSGKPYVAGLSVGGIQAALKSEKARVLQDIAHSRSSRIQSMIMGLYRQPGPSLPQIRPLQAAEFGGFRRLSRLRELENGYGRHPDIAVDGPYGRELDTDYVDGLLRTLGVRK